MAGGDNGRSLEETPTWAVAGVCFVLLVISISIEHVIDAIGQWLTRRHKRALSEALEKVKAELMLLGFISLLLTVGQGPISEICIPKALAATWHPCPKSREAANDSKKNSGEYSSAGVGHSGRNLLDNTPLPFGLRRVLAAGAVDKCATKNKAPLVSTGGIHQLHIFIFVLAVFHVLYCISTMALGRLKMRKWKSWEQEVRTINYQLSHDPERCRLIRETSFGRRHLRFWTKSPVLAWIVCFFRQFFTSVPKVDYMTLRHGFIVAHLPPTATTTFNFQKYIQRCLDEDFKVVVEISPLIWFCAVIFLLFNTHGWYAYLWLPFIPLIFILAIGAKLQMIITNMAKEILARGDVVKGAPQVHLTNDHFWFHRPKLILFLIHFVLFQNAFQLAFFVWSSYQFGLNSCFHEHTEDVAIRLSMGILIQVLCSYVTLPLYALVTQMGSNLRPSIFNERVAMALKKWHHTSRKNVKENHRSATASPLSGRSPVHGLSPVHLLGHHPAVSNNFWPSPSFYKSMDDNRISLTTQQHNVEDRSPSHKYKSGEDEESIEQSVGATAMPVTKRQAYAVDISSDFSFNKGSKA